MASSIDTSPGCGCQLCQSLVSRLVFLHRGVLVFNIALRAKLLRYLWSRKCWDWNLVHVHCVTHLITNARGLSTLQGKAGYSSSGDRQSNIHSIITMNYLCVEARYFGLVSTTLNSESPERTLHSYPRLCSAGYLDTRSGGWRLSAERTSHMPHQPQLSHVEKKTDLESSSAPLLFSSP